MDNSHYGRETVNRTGDYSSYITTIVKRRSTMVDTKRRIMHDIAQEMCLSASAKMVICVLWRRCEFHVRSTAATAYRATLSIPVANKHALVTLTAYATHYHCRCSHSMVVGTHNNLYAQKPGTERNLCAVNSITLKWPSRVTLNTTSITLFASNTFAIDSSRTGEDCICPCQKKKRQ